jgi:hypothetical protein
MHATSRGLRRSLLIVIIASLVFAFLRGVAFKRIETGDEGVNGTMALNMCKSLQFFTRPSYLPGGSTDWAKDDLDGIANTPFHSALLALGGCLLSGRPEGMGLISFIALVVSLIFTYRLFALWNRRAAIVTTLLLAVSPAILWPFRELEFEPVLVAWGMAGTYFIARGELSGKKALSLLGGACLGASFLTKLWLVAPFVLAASGLILTTRVRAREWRIAPVALIVTGFLGVASLHLLYIAVRSPGDLSLWLRHVYFAPFVGEGIGGSKMSGSGVPPEWVHPFWYYPAILYRDHFFLCPILVMGFPSLVKRASSFAMPLAAIGGVLVSLALLSIPPIKEPLYILATLPFLYGLAGLGVAALLSRSAAGDDLGSATDRWALRGGGVLAVVMSLSMTAAHVIGLKRDDITLPYVTEHALGIGGAFLLVYMATRLDPARWIKLASGLAALAVTGFAAYDLFGAAEPPYKEIAEILRPYVEPQPPGHESFISPSYKILQFYLYRNGRYWQSYFTALRPAAIEERIDSGDICGLVIGPKDRQDPGVAELERSVAGRFIDLSARLPVKDQQIYRVLANRSCLPGEGR